MVDNIFDRLMPSSPRGKKSEMEALALSPRIEISEPQPTKGPHYPSFRPVASCTSLYNNTTYFTPNLEITRPTLSTNIHKSSDDLISKFGRKVSSMAHKPMAIISPRHDRTNAVLKVSNILAEKLLMVRTSTNQSPAPIMI